MAMPTNLRWTERNMWDAQAPTQAEVRLLLGRISRLRESLAQEERSTAEPEERIPDCRYPGGPGCPNATPDGPCCMEKEQTPS